MRLATEYEELNIERGEIMNTILKANSEKTLSDLSEMAGIISHNAFTEPVAVGRYCRFRK